MNNLLSSKFLKFNTLLKKHTLYIILSTIFCSLYVLRDIIGIDVSFYIIYLVGALIILFTSNEENIAFIISISAFSNGGFSGGFGIIMFCCFLLKFYYTLKKISLTVIILIILCLLEVCHFIYYPNINSSILFTYIFFVGVLILFIQYPHDKLDKKFIIKSFIVFSLFYNIMAVAQMTILYGSFNALLSLGFRSEYYVELLEQNRLLGNANFVTALCSLNICLCALLIEKKYDRIFCFISLGIFIFTALLTVSKMFLVVIAFYIIYIIIQSFKKKFSTGIVVSLFLFVLSVFAIKLFGDNLVSLLFERFQSGDLTTGRVDIIMNLMIAMNDNPISYLIGFGIFQLPNYTNGHAVHSSFFEVLGGWGFFGLILCSLYLIKMFVDSYKIARKSNQKISGFNYLPLIMFLGYSFIGMFFSSSFSLIEFMVVIYAIELKRNTI